MRFRIEWTDPETQELRVAIKDFADTPNVPASLWAEDWAYMVADKGYHRIVKLED